MPEPGWSEFTLRGHPCDRFEPARRNEHGYVVLYLHGVHQGRLRDHPPMTAELERHGLPAVAPRTQRSWWTDRICPEFDAEVSAERHLLEHALPWIADEFDAAPPRIGLFGTSMGGQGALRLAYKHPDLFPVVAALSPAIDFHERYEDAGYETLKQMYPSAEAARQDTATLHVHPFKWPRRQFFACDPEDRWVNSSERLQMKLASQGVPHECDLETRAGGHGFGYYNQQAAKAFAFLVDGLDRERRRVV